MLEPCRSSPLSLNLLLVNADLSPPLEQVLEMEKNIDTFPFSPDQRGAGTEKLLLVVSSWTVKATVTHCFLLKDKLITEE